MIVKNPHSSTFLYPVRLPIEVKAEIAALRKMARKLDVNFAASFATFVIESLAKYRKQLEEMERKP